MLVSILMVTLLSSSGGIAATQPTRAQKEQQALEQFAAEEKGLYILTPKVPRAVKAVAHRIVADEPAPSISGAVLAWESVLVCSAADGDLDGDWLEGAFFDESCPNRAGQPFTYYDGALRPSDCYLFAHGLEDGGVKGLDFVATYERTEEPRPGAISLFGENWTRAAANSLSDPPLPHSEYGWMNELALSPAITRDNPLVLYQTAAGMGGATLDGGAFYCLYAEEGYCGEEVQYLTRKLHAKRPAGIQDGEEVIRVNRALAREDVVNPYPVNQKLSPQEQAGVSALFKEEGYRITGFTFERIVSPRIEDERYLGVKTIPLTGAGTCKIEVVFRPEGETKTSATARVQLDEWQAGRAVEAAATEQEIREWAGRELALPRNQRLMRERASARLGLSRWDTMVPVDDFVRGWLGEFSGRYDGEDCYCLVLNTHANQGFSRVTYRILALAELGEATTAENLVLTCYALADRSGDGPDSIIQAGEGENLAQLLDRLRKADDEARRTY